MPSSDGLFFTIGIGLATALGAFGISLGIARKRSPDAFAASLPQGHESPTRLAVRALGWGTICAVVGVGSIVMAVKCIARVSNVKEFGAKVNGLLPTKYKLNSRPNTSNHEDD